MWISLSDGFLSVVADENDPARLLIRARRQKDLEAFVGMNVQLDHTPNADYGWRTFISREVFKRLMVDRIDGINYTNFKNSVKDEDLHDLYLGFWQDHRRYQETDPKSKKDRRSHFAWGPNDFELVPPPEKKS
jgi:hypothetical protein